MMGIEQVTHVRMLGEGNVGALLAAPSLGGAALPLRGEGKRGAFEQMLLPVPPAQEILSRKLALSEGGGLLEVRDV